MTLSRKASSSEINQEQECVLPNIQTANACLQKLRAGVCIDIPNELSAIPKRERWWTFWILVKNLRFVKK